MEIFDLVNLEELTLTFLQNAVAVEDLVRKNPSCSNLVMTALFKLLNKYQAISTSNATKILSIGGDFTPGKVVEVFNLENQPAAVYPDLLMNADCGWAVKLYDYVYNVGGHNINKQTNRCEAVNKVYRFKIKQGYTFDEVSSMHDARTGLGAAVFCDTIVVTGGVNKEQMFLQISECYIPQVNEWKQIANLKMSKAYHALVSCGGCLYDIGGVDENGISSAVERLRGLKEEWEFAPPMHEKRTGLAAVACKDCVYAIGGRSGDNPESLLKTVEKYDATVNRWSLVEEMKFYRAGHFACVLNGKIFVIGGRDADGTAVREIEVYDPNTNTWSVVGRTKKRLYNHYLVVV